MTCKSCPFAFTEHSEHVQNYGCLPTPYEIIEMKKISGHNWACHNNENRVCKGFVDYVDEFRQYPHNRLDDIDVSSGKLISYDVWYREGPQKAMQKAKEVEK